jgi:peptidoglycan/xylan/chitin deacetylase (PgdA/CDA1 family)
MATKTGQVKYIEEVEVMSSRVNIVMYHYIRDLVHSRYPKIKGLDIAHFRQQIEFFKNNGYNFISPEILTEAISNKNILPDNSVLLTFDDGYIDQYTYVFPILKEHGISAFFSMPGKIIAEHKVLDVNKIHFLLAAVKIEELLEATFEQLDFYRGSEYTYPANQDLFVKLAHPDRFDTSEVIFIKRLLQVELPEKLRNLITDELFRRYIPLKEEVFARELYMSMDQVHLMKQEGMCFGYHGYDHYWMNRLEEDVLIADIDRALDFFSGVIDKNGWICCYPYGSYSDSVIEIAKSKGAIWGLGTEVGVADISAIDLFKLPRLDTNDFPPMSENYLRCI